MSDKDPPMTQRPGVPFESEDAREQQLWDQLNALPPAEPSPRLRRRFYDRLDEAGRPSRADQLRRWLGLTGTAGILTATAAAVGGLVVGLALSTPSADRTDLAALRAQVETLNRSLILDRLQSDSASKRLRGVIDAAGVARNDPEVTRALLTRAVEDRVYSVRSAAIDAIGSALSTPAVGDELMAALERSESPLVQLAVVDVVLRHGSAEQLERLVRLSQQGSLHPDVVQHVTNSIRRDPV
jgi:hypothetical protein